MNKTSIEKWQEEEKIRISFLKHRGDILAVVKDTNYDLQYVKRVSAKIEKAQRRDIDRLVANDIAQVVLSGFEQRERSYLSCLNGLEGKETAKVSLCHGAPVKEHAFGGDIFYTCLKCEETCGAKIVEKTAIYKLIIEFNEQLREETKLLLEFAEKMGYTHKVEVPGDKITQYNLVLPGSGIDDKTLSDLQNLTGPDRQRLRRKLEQRIIESEFENNAKK